MHLTMPVYVLLSGDVWKEVLLLLVLATSAAFKRESMVIDEQDVTMAMQRMPCRKDDNTFAQLGDFSQANLLHDLYLMCQHNFGPGINLTRRAFMAIEQRLESCQHTLIQNG